MNLQNKKGDTHMKIDFEQFACAGILLLSLAGFSSFGSGIPTSSSNEGAPVAGAVTPSVTVRGTVKFDGVAPKPAHINMAQEPSCAKMHGGTAASQEVVIGPNGSLANVIVYISEGLTSPVADAPPSSPMVIEQKGCMYEPHVLALQAGQDLKVINSDSTSHNIHPMPANNREWNKSQPPGSPAIEATFAREEIAIPVKCNIHPWMKSYIGVFKNPYFSVTDKNGSFELKNLPPGTYTVSAWHEKYGTVTQNITVGANESKAIELDFKAKAGY